MTSVVERAAEAPSREDTALVIEAGRGASLPTRPSRDALTAILDRHPRLGGSVCLRSRDRSFTRDELFERARRWATVLSLSNSSRIAVLLERSIEHMAIMLGGWWAGKSVVVLDTESPVERLRAMFLTSEADLLVSEARPDWLPDAVATVSEVDAREAVPTAAEPAPAEMAYVIYTSGSSGVPKGVEVPHAALAAKLESLVLASEMAPGKRVIAHHAFSADVSLMETYAPLLGGMETYVAEGDERKVPDGLADTLARVDPDLLYISSTGARLLVDSGWPGSARLMLDVGGEKFPLDLARQLLGRVRRLINGYGPTEACIKCAHHDIREAGLVDCASVPFGKPLHDVRMFVLRSDGTLAERGEEGELVIGGLHLAAGYVGRADVTAEKFVDIEVEGESLRVYRTGDLVRWTSAYLLEFVGRADDQVKLHGTRVELGEVAHAVAAAAGVDDAVCEVVDGALVAYVLSALPRAEVEAIARTSTADRLPAKLQPADYVVVPTWPLTTSGKLDRQLLRSEARKQTANSSVARLLAGMLGLAEVSTDAMLVELGVDSLVRVSLLAKLRASGALLSFGDLYSARTVGDLDALVGRRGRLTAAEDAATPTPPVPYDPRSGDGEVLDPATGFEFFATRLHRPGSYGTDVMWAVTTAPLGELTVREAFAHLCEAAPALRARIEGIEGGLRWRIPSGSAPLVVHAPVADAELESSLRAVAEAEGAAGIEPFDAPLFRAYVVASSKRTGLVVVYHSLLLDRTSAQDVLDAWFEARLGPLAPRPWVRSPAREGELPTAEYLAMLDAGGRVPSLPILPFGALARAGKLGTFVRATVRVLRGFGAIAKHAAPSPKYEEERGSILAKVADLRAKLIVVDPTDETVLLDRGDRDVIRAHTDRLAVSVHAVVLGAVAKAIAEWLGHREVFPGVVVNARKPEQEHAIGICSASVPTMLRPEVQDLDGYVRAASECLRLAIENRHVPQSAFEAHLKGAPPWVQFAFHGLAQSDARRGARDLQVLGARTTANMLLKVVFHPDGELSFVYDAGRFDRDTVRALIDATTRSLHASGA